MMRTMLWKEYREHRLIWLTMLVVNCGALIGLSEFDQMIFSPRGESKLTMLGPVAALLVWGYGMVCGAMLLAGEREEGTLSFLDILPVSRLHLWLYKGQVGLLLLVGQILVLCVCLTGLRATEDPTLLGGLDTSRSLWPYALGMLVLGMVGMAYALFFSARGENVLHTIGLAIVGQIIAGIAAGISAFTISILLIVSLSWLEIERHDFGRILGTLVEGPMVVFSAFVGFTLTALVGSARIFGREDRQRRPVAVRRLRGRASLVVSWLRIVWLCYRQMFRLALGVLAFSLFLGVLFLLIGPLMWPVATLGLGVLCGVTVFSDEQTLGSFRFLGDQRFPLGRIWVIKTSVRFALLLLASFLILLPFIMVGVYHGMTERGEPPLIREMPYLVLLAEVVPWPTFLLMWLLYGFCAGQLCSLLSRKSIVAAMIAFMISALLVTLWIPSVAGIGLHFWQIAVPPLILSITAWFLMRTWAADRLASWKTWLGVITAVAASLVWMTFGIWYRVIEIPDVPEPFDVAAYKATVPMVDENKAGQLIRSVWGKVESAMNAMHDPRTRKPLFPDWDKVLEDGWPEGRSELGDWMDREFAQDWLQELVTLPDLPLGILIDPQLLTLRDLNKVDSRNWSFAGGFSALLAARGLQQQARGDPAVFVEHMRIALALSRNLEHHSSPSGTFFLGLHVARVWPAAVDLWLKKQRGRPDLLRRALQTLLDHEAKLPDEQEQFRADYLIIRNTLESSPDQLLDQILPDHSKERKEAREAELRTVVLLWLFPWEQERHWRLLRLAFRINDRDVRKIIDWGGRTFASLEFFINRRARNQLPRELVTLRACQLKVALRLYEEENGDLPDTLDALVPRYLKALPRDPLTNNMQPFHYRRSRGEWIAWPEPSQPPGGPGMADAPGGEVPLMPRADGPAAPPAHAGAAPGADMAAGGRVVDENGIPPLEGIPFMPRVDEPAGPQPIQRMPRRGMGMVFPNGQPMPAGEQLPRRFVPKGQGILWSVGEDGQDDGGQEQAINLNPSFLGQDVIYLVPPAP
jgi:hypothetical protein